MKFCCVEDCCEAAEGEIRHQGLTSLFCSPHLQAHKYELEMALQPFQLVSLERAPETPPQAIARLESDLALWRDAYDTECKARAEIQERLDQSLFDRQRLNEAHSAQAVELAEANATILSLSNLVNSRAAEAPRE